MANLKGLVLAGGTGTRLRPITHTSAKQLVPLANKPILFYGLEALAEAGVKEVGVIVGETGPEVIAAVGTGEQFGLNITYIPQEAPLGLAHCVAIARDFLGDSEFVMFLGDNLIKDGIVSFTQAFQNRTVGTAAEILLAKVPDPHRFGVAELDSDGRVKRLVEKPVIPPSDLALVGVYFFDNTIHQAVASILPSGRGELEITDAIQWLIDSGFRVSSHQITGYWKDLGEPEALLEGNRLVLEDLERRIDGTLDPKSEIEGRVVVERGARLVRSRVRGPAIIGADSLIEDAYVGPFTSVGQGCVIRETEIENSVILEGVSLIGVGRLEGSILGKNAQIKKRNVLPRANRLVVGDHSIVDLA